MQSAQYDSSPGRAPASSTTPRHGRRLLLPLLAFLAGGGLGLVGGVALGIFVYPFWFLTEVASEAIPTPGAQRLVATGEFIHANPSDPIHWGRGQVRVLEDQSRAHLVHLDETFEVGPGPAFHVYLVDHPMVRSGADFAASEMVDLGRLKAFKGSQNYAVPQGIDLARHRSVVIWCKQFSVLISPATLRPAT
jgi:hypothetical protein